MKTLKYGAEKQKRNKLQNTKPKLGGIPYALPLTKRIKLEDSEELKSANDKLQKAHSDDVEFRIKKAQEKRQRKEATKLKNGRK